jgi:hypothetical protein
MKMGVGRKEIRGIKGQTQISFGMIFSVILIIIFIAFAIYGITQFLKVKNFGQIETFKSNIQSDIDTTWKSTQGNQTKIYSLPNKIKQVCFVNNQYENMYFMPSNSGYKGTIINNVDFIKTIIGSKSVPKKLCIDSIDGKISMIMGKSWNENLVTIYKTK